MSGDTTDPRPETGNYSTAFDFLKAIRLHGPWTLTSIHDGTLRSETFGPRTITAMGRWVRERSGRVNLYFHINPTYGHATKSKLEQVSHLERLHVDIDPDYNSPTHVDDQRRAILALLLDEARLQKIGLPGGPTSIVDSGGGYWAFWDLVEPYSLRGATQQDCRDNAHRAGGHNKWLAEIINKELELKVADDCHNVDRIARLPGTQNIPTAKKIAKGRRPELANWLRPPEWPELQFALERKYTLDLFGWVDTGDAGPCAEAVEAVRIEGNWTPLPQGDAWEAVQELVRRYPEVRPKTTELILLGGYLHPEGEDLPTKAVDGQMVIDRNAPFHRVNRALQQAGVPLPGVVAVLSDPRFAVSEHMRFPANRAGKVSTTEVRGAELMRGVTGQVKKAAAKLAKEAFDARKAAEALDGATVPSAPPPTEGGEAPSHPPEATSSFGNGATPPPPPPPGSEPPQDDGPLPREMRFDHGAGPNGVPGPPLKTERNILVALRRLGVRLSYNRFADQLLIDGLEGFGPELNDAAVTSLWLTIDRIFGFRPTKNYFYDVITNACLANTFHPVFDYLGNLSWDGIPRLNGWLTTYGGAKDTPYTNAVGKLMLVAAVRRLRRPGAKFDEMAVLEGAQGTNKSTALKILAVREEWFLDDLPLGASSKEMIEQMTGKWIVEIADLHKKHKPDVNKIKAQLSRTEDRARLSYGKLSVSVKRQCVFFATTNEKKYLEDPTGERRFWPVLTQRFDLEGLLADRDQLWAEAATLEARGDSIRMDQVLWAEAAAEQSERSILDPWVEHLDELLGTLQGKILNSDVWRLVGITADKLRRHDTLRISQVMKQLGFDNASLRFKANGVHKKARGYVRGSTSEFREVQLMVRMKDDRTFVMSENVAETDDIIETQAHFEEEIPF